MQQLAKPSYWFWVIAIIALLWNAVGVAEYFRQMTMSGADFAALPTTQQELIANQPFWLTAAFAIAVFSGFMGALALLFQRSIAVRLFFLSLLAVIIQFGGLLLFKDYWDTLSDVEIIMPLLIPIFAIGFAFYARHCEQAGILN